ncbi:S-layer homology domain-containing protein [Flavonifractor sp. An112]|uniref:S-layer homology domain-containing protein n=1 Tax=Flavonifractor sp. An112 TaxID=1965544 RepID=UPI00174CEF2B|nr:S-layer homology domain-containing protein [Flavonifractor sp. An112]HIZ93686.1 S-layer homology domain-containing protein [Candidatus Flavonifractor avicola]
MRKLSLFFLTLCLMAAALIPGAAAAGGLRLVVSSQEPAATQTVGFSGLPSDCQSLQATFTLSDQDASYGFAADQTLAGRTGVYVTAKQNGASVTVYATAKSGVLSDDGSLTLGTISSTDGATTFTVEKAIDLKLIASDNTETTYPSADEEGAAAGTTSYAINVKESTGGSVTASRTRANKGLTITLTAKASEGYKLDTLTVTDKNSNAVKLTDKGSGKYTFTMPASAVTVSASFVKGDTPVDTGLPFTDVVSGSWYYDSVAYVYEQGLMGGTGEGRFSPDLTTSRAMIVTILYRLEGSPAVTGSASFADVASGQWYSDGVAWASANGIVTGYSNGSFGPDDTITREQMAAILYRYARYKGYDLSAQADLDGYSDAAQVSAYAADAMEWAVGSGLITGTSGTTLSPAGSATRAQAAVILARFCQTLAQ